MDNSEIRRVSREEKKLLAQLTKSQRSEAVTLRDKSVMKPSAQHVKPCESGTDLDKIVVVIESALNKLEYRDARLHALVDIQYSYGMRIGEALGIKCYDIKRNGRVILKGTKRSSDRIIIPVRSKLFFQRCFERNQAPFDIYDRFFIYREYKKLGIMHYFKENSKYAVTHLFRYLAIKELSQGETDSNLVSEFIGHKNKNNTKIYEKKR